MYNGKRKGIDDIVDFNLFFYTNPYFIFVITLDKRFSKDEN